MKTILTSLLAGCAALLVTCSGQAQHRSFITADAGPYFRFDAGVSFQQDGRITKFPGGPTGGSIDYDPGFNFSAAVGYSFNKYLSLEMEFGANGNEISSANGFALYDTFLFNAPLLANVVFQYPIPRTRLVPYAGAGVGGSFTAFDTDGFSNGEIALVGSDDDFVFAYQAFAGLRFQLSESMSLGVGYKYFATGDLSFSYPPFFPGTGPNASIGIEGVRSHMVTFAFQMKF